MVKRRVVLWYFNRSWVLRWQLLHHVVSTAFCSQILSVLFLPNCNVIQSVFLFNYYHGRFACSHLCFFTFSCLHLCVFSSEPFPPKKYLEMIWPWLNQRCHRPTDVHRGGTLAFSWSKCSLIFSWIACDRIIPWLGYVVNHSQLDKPYI